MSKPDGIPVADLGVEQLSALQKQLDQEINFFTQSAATLKSFADKVGQSQTALEVLESSTTGTTALVPLTESMYVRAELSDPSKMLIGLGTGYYAEISREKAADFFDRKKKHIQEQIDTIERLLLEKRRSRTIIVDNLQSKISQQFANMASLAK